MFSTIVESSLRTRNVIVVGFGQATLLSHEGALWPTRETAELSKNNGSQVLTGCSLPRVYVTSRIKVSARWSRWATVRMAPENRKAFNPRNLGGRPWSITSWSSLLVRSLAVRAA